MNKTVYESLNMYKTRGMINGNLNLIKHNTSLMSNYYINRGINLFNRLPTNIKLINNDVKFKIILKNMYMPILFNIRLYYNTICIATFLGLVSLSLYSLL